MAARQYPTWITRPDGAKIIVHSLDQHAAHMGVPIPPSEAEVIAAGYSPEAAKEISEREMVKFNAGIKPYGDKPETEPDKFEELFGGV